MLTVLLSTDACIPSSLDPNTACKVVLAFLRPGSEVPYIGGSYTSLEGLRKRLRKIPNDEVDEILGWLKSIGILNEWAHKKAGKRLVSLRIRAREVDSPGSEIARALRKVVHEKVRMG